LIEIAEFDGVLPKVKVRENSNDSKKAKKNMRKMRKVAKAYNTV